MRPLLLSFLILCLAMTDTSAQYPGIKWFMNVDDMAFGQAALADLDGDTYPEIVFSTYRNDGKVYALNAEDGSTLWVFDPGGCMDVAPVIYDVDDDDTLDVIIPGSCVAKTFCINGRTGKLKWQANTRGSDSPPTIADIDGDGKPEILHGEFGGYVICLNGENGSQAWEIAVDVNSWIQTAPTIVDLDLDGNLDFVVANWNFDTNHRIFAYKASTHSLLWESNLPDDVMYHGSSIANLDEDPYPELTIGSYDGFVYALNGEDGSLLWKYAFPTQSYYIGAPTSTGDLDKDGKYEVVFFDVGRVGVLSNEGALQWSFSFGGAYSSFRGAALSDIDGDDTLDIVFGTGDGRVFAVDGNDGGLIWTTDLAVHYGNDFEIDHAPVIADFDKDGILDLFLVGGYAEYPAITNNYGRAYALSCGPGTGPDWPMFQRDIRRTSLVPYDTSSSGIETILSTAGLEVYPNPSHIIPSIIYSSDYRGVVQFDIYDALGRSIYRADIMKDVYKLEFTPSVPTLQPGIYILSAGSAANPARIKFILR